jgi:hypothetical protein
MTFLEAANVFGETIDLICSIGSASCLSDADKVEMTTELLHATRA